MNFKTGKLNSNAADPHGEYPFFTCSRETFRTNTYSFDGPYILLAGNNAAGIYPLKYFEGKFDAYQRTYVIDVGREDVLNLRYLFYALETKLAHLRSISTGAATKFLTLKLLNRLEVPTPPLPTQKKIASILSAYDDLIENNEKRIKILEEMARSLYREWFVHFRFPDHDSVKMVDSEMGKIPEGWEVRKLGDIAREDRRSIPKGKLDVPTRYVGLEHIPRKSLALNSWDTVEELGSNKLLFNEDEILFGKIRPYFHKVSIAPFEGICSADTIVISEKDRIHREIVTAVVSSEDFVAHATSTSNGSKMPRANWKVLVGYPLAIPSCEKLLSTFGESFRSLTQLQKVLVKQNENLRDTRDLLLPRLISGELDVSELDIQEIQTGGGD